MHLKELYLHAVTLAAGGAQQSDGAAARSHPSFRVVLRRSKAVLRSVSNVHVRLCRKQQQDTRK